MILDILIYPNSKLNMKSKTVEKFDDKLHTLLDNMNETMKSKDGIGLAGVQVGNLKNVFIINIPDKDNNQFPENLIEVVNPKILSSEGNVVYEEGCLSLPEFHEDVKRADKIEVEFQDRNGKIVKASFTDLSAIAFQHEFDHLQGKLFVERVSFLKRRKFQKEWKKR